MVVRLYAARNKLDSWFIAISNPGPFGIEAAREKALVKSGHVIPQILDIA